MYKNFKLSDEMFDNYNNRFVPIILPIILIFFWYLITNGLGLFSSYILPGPIDVINSGYSKWKIAH